MSKFEFLAQEQVLAFYLLSPGQPYIQGIESSLFPSDFSRALKRAYNKEEIELAEEMTGKQMQGICEWIYEKYCDAAHDIRLAESEKKNAEAIQGYKDTQMFEY